MNPYLSEKARGEIPRFLKWLRNAGLAFCVFCSVGGLYTLCLSLQDKDYSHIGGYVFWIVVGAVPLALFARGEARRYHARTIARLILACRRLLLRPHDDALLRSPRALGNACALELRRHHRRGTRRHLVRDAAPAAVREGPTAAHDSLTGFIGARAPIPMPISMPFPMSLPRPSR